jgi:hypothetical protein
MDREVAVRAYRGTKRTAVYEEHLLSSSRFRRIVAVGAAHDLGLLASLARRGHRKLGKESARRLAEETTRLRTSGEVPDLDEDLARIAEVARWCARATGNAWMRIEAP